MTREQEDEGGWHQSANRQAQVIGLLRGKDVKVLEQMKKTLYLTC